MTHRSRTRPVRSPTPPGTADYRQHLEVETPEHVVLDYELAGLGSRAAAAVADTIILGTALLALTLLFGVSRSLATPLGAALFLFVGFALNWGYFTLFEGLRRGQTPGKRWMGIRVVRDTGHAATLGDAAARNLLRLADFLPPPYLIGGILVAVHPRAKRLGDLVAGTVVVRDRPAEIPAAGAQPGGPGGRMGPGEAGSPELTDDEFRVLREFMERAPTLPQAARERLLPRLAARLARFPDRGTSAEGFLLELYQSELERRKGRFGARTRSAGGPAHGPGVIERLVALKQPRWQEFQHMAERAARAGLDDFAPEELVGFAARYREVAADLARARTYGAAAGLLGQLERLVAAGHNALYRSERETWRRIARFFAVECPAAVLGARRYVLLAFLAFALPAAGGYMLLRERPGLAADVLPDVMLERAEAGAARVRQGHGYVETAAGSRPLVATSIITNNISVAFNCFAGGVFAGVGSLVFLAYNGLSIGAASGHFANVGMLGYLWTFVIGHGVLELFAIWVAGAGGFLLGRALIAPGDLARRDALVIQGRVAIRLVGAATVLLVVAGLIEGFVSSGRGPLPLRLAVSGASLVFLLLYLWNGARR